MHKKFYDLTKVLLVYLGAYILSFPIILFNLNPLVTLFLMDLIMTVIIYVISIIIKNASIYDPYWSFIPLVLVLTETIFTSNLSIPNIVYLIIFGIWSFRLTLNWCITFTDFTYQDWRYKNLKAKTGKLYPLVSFFGIMLFPTLLTYAGTLPGLIFIRDSSVFSPIYLVGLSLIMIGTLLETTTDSTIHKFIRNPNNKGKTCQLGLYKYSRHPNYLGENLVWIGTYVLLISLKLHLWYFFGGALAIYLMFRLISIPMLEKRELARRSDYQNYIKTTSSFFILPKKQQESETESIA